MALVGKI